MKTLDDIVFEKRNKSYGSYDLRKKYGKAIFFSIFIGIFTLGVVLAFPVVASFKKSQSINKEVKRTVDAEILNKPKPDIQMPPPQLQTSIKSVSFLAPKVVNEDVETDFGIQEDLNLKPNQGISEDFLVGGENPEKPVEKVIDVIDSEKIHIFVEEWPTLDNYAEFIAENIRYPEEARQLDIQGNVYVNFVVEADGSISNVTVARGIGGGCDEEAVRVVKLMPKWKPGKQQGMPVRVQFNLPIKFTLASS